MLETYGNIWDLVPKYESLVITTNGFIKKNGEAVMGRGIAKEAKEKFPELSLKLGNRLKKDGNKTMAFSISNFDSQTDYSIYSSNTQLNTKMLFTFPVKPEFGTNGEPGWKARADLDLIKRSTEQLVEMINIFEEGIGSPFIKFLYNGNFTVIIPRPGCGNGGLKWEQVKPVIEPLLDDRFTVVTFNPYD